MFKFLAFADGVFLILILVSSVKCILNFGKGLKETLLKQTLNISLLNSQNEMIN